jgi:hypothetical protein
MRALAPALCLTSFILISGFASVPAAAFCNRNSPLGINLSEVNYYTSEQPFLNIFQTGSMWLTQNNGTWDTGEQSKLDVDPSGWIKSLSGMGGQPVNYTSVGMLVLRKLPAPYYPSGQYVLIYDGEGIITYSFDAEKVTRASRPGRDVLNVTPSDAGILIQIKTTDPKHTGDYIRNIRLVKADQENLLNSGEIFNPIFIDRVTPFCVFRFMDWMKTNDSTQSAWNDRPLQTKAYYGDGFGVPLEVMVKLSNKLHADPWFNIPAMATDDYIANFATLAHQLLNNTQKVYVEYSNETWNFLFKQADWMGSQGHAMWPSSRLSDFEKNLNWSGMRTAQTCDIWKSVWGPDANRIICVMASQAANSWVAKQSLSCPLWSEAPCSSNHGISALAIAPYFGGRGVPSSWTSEPDGGLSSLFKETMRGGVDPSGYPGGLIQEAIDWTIAQKKVADSFGLPLIAYEGGQHFVNSNDTVLTDVYLAANRDIRMGMAYTTYLQKWKEAGGQLFSHYAGMGKATKWGSWGALENVIQTGSPKYDALIDFISRNPCWWTGCTAHTKQ